MSFNSLQYAIFLPVVFLAYHYCRDSIRWLVLLAASLVFYSALRAPQLLLALIIVILLNYFLGIRIGTCTFQKRRHAILWAGIAANVLVLAIIRYFPFIARNLDPFIGTLLNGMSIHTSEIVVSIGVSYFVFQAISYLVDIYLEIGKPERHIGYFALSIAFFPKLLQGPIERSEILISQLRRAYVFEYENVRAGILLFAWGLFMKVVLADRLALFADEVFNNPHSYAGVSLMVGIYAYAFQVFFDFCGYTNMALGTARIFNIRLTRNFDSPYLSTSVAEFWRRWHISFSRWILDYIFRPLQMKWRGWGSAGTASALLITFFVSGVWHGASGGFIVWGGLHGVFLASAVYWKPYKEKLYRKFRIAKGPMLTAWQVGITFHLVCASWIFFRSRTISDSLYVIGHLFSPPTTETLSQHDYIVKVLLVNQSWREAAVIVLALAAMGMASILRHRHKVPEFGDFILDKPCWFRWGLYAGLGTAVLVFGVFSIPSFIYYRF